MWMVVRRIYVAARPATVKISVPELRTDAIAEGLPVISVTSF
jgi:hypothetical protein